MSNPMPKVQSVQRALSILEILSISNQPLSAIEISQQAGLNRTTVHNLLETLIACHYVEKDRSGKKYVTTVKMLAFSSAYSDNLPVVRFCSAILNDLATHNQVALHLGILTNENTLFIIKKYVRAASPHKRGSTNLPFHATSIGKVFLTFLPSEKTMEILETASLTPFTKDTITDQEVLLQELECSRKQGYTFGKGEYIENIFSIGFPIFNEYNELAGAFSLSAAKDILEAKKELLIPEGLQASKLCSSELGCHTPPYCVNTSA